MDDGKYYAWISLALAVGLAATLVYPLDFLQYTPETSKNIVSMLGVALIFLSVFALCFPKLFRNAAGSDVGILKVRALTLVTQLQAFNASHRQTEALQNEAERTALPWRITDDEQRQRIWAASQQSSALRSEQFRHQFFSQFGAEIRALVPELIRELTTRKIAIPQNPHGERAARMVIDASMLAGANPIGFLANYIEDLAKALPDAAR